MESYLVGKVLGQGQFGCIREAVRKDNGDPVVVKIIRVTRMGEGVPHPVAREAVIAPRLQHQYVVRTLDVFTEDTSVVLVMEKCHTTVAAMIQEHSPLRPMPSNLVKRLMGMLLSGVAYIHSMGVLHRDIKPSNCLLTMEKVLKIGDFGLSRLKEVNEDMSHEVQSRWYRAPELLMGKRRYGEEIDMWSVGCVMAELIRGYGDPIFCGDGDIAQLSLIFDLLGTPDAETAKDMPDWGKIHFAAKKGTGIESVIPNAHPLAIDLLKKMLCVNPRMRFSARQLLAHPYFVSWC